MPGGSIQHENLRLIALSHVLSLEKGRIDVQRPAGGNVNDRGKRIIMMTCAMGA